ncbi:efflux RND transporter periplasmic adaptor subunit [Sunxiuqinia sp. A32]|uniref:efflux RND transporter periplasmic adaptor subunit n=1 Tax=Sunxiuqinia sp. A32 TaxID=3461496 RepID=UPI004045C8F3
MKQLNTFIFILAISALSLTSCSDKKAEDGKKTNIEVAKAERVRTIILENQEITRTIEYTSTLVPFNIVHMAPTSPGRIEAINVEMGDKVRKGDELVRMNDAQLNQAMIQLNNLETDYSRLDTLKKLGSIAQQQYDQLKAQYEVAKENVQFLQKNTILEAPFNGVISGKYFEAGEMYSGAPVATVGKAAILSIIQVERLKAIVSISEKYFPSIHNGMEVSLQFDVYPGETFNGKIFRISPTINPQSRSFEVEVSVNNPTAKLRPGMFGRVTIGLEKTNANVLPALAILKMQGSNIRYLFVDNKGKAKRIEVQLGKRYDDKVEVISDELKLGDRVIIEGQARLLDEMPIEVLN